MGQKRYMMLPKTMPTIVFCFLWYSEIAKNSWWRHQIETFSRYWPFVRGIHRWPVNSSHKGQWRWVLMLILICALMIGWINDREAGDWRHRGAHYDVIVMFTRILTCNFLPPGLSCGCRSAIKQHLRTLLLPEAGISDRDNLLHPAVYHLL